MEAALTSSTPVAPGFMPHMLEFTSQAAAKVADLIVDGSRMKSQGILHLLVKEIGERWKP